MDGYHIGGSGQKDLQDDGKRDLDDEIQIQLDSYYENWRNPETTFMVPPVFISKKSNPDIGERTEKDFFELLQDFGEKNSEPMFVVHSYKFSEYIHEWESGTKCLPKWVMGEHDFVVIHRQHGVLFFQVKAAKALKSVNQKVEEQIHKDKVSLMKFFDKMVEAKKVSKKQAEKVFNHVPAFVVLPNSPRENSIFAKDHVICQEDCSSLEAFSAWWDKFVAKLVHPQIDETIFQLLVMRFVGMVHVSPLLSTCVDKSERTLVFKTTEQVKILAGHYPPKLWIRGPAGSGKTFLLLEKVETLASDILKRKLDEKILVVCFNSVLRKDLEVKLHSHLDKRFPAVASVLECKTFHQLIMDVIGLKKPPSSVKDQDSAVAKALNHLQKKTSRFCGKYSHIFVDEGQDLYGCEWPKVLEQMHKSSVEDAELGGLKKSGFFWVMYDSNQYLYFSKQKLTSHAVYLRESAELNKVFRNTENIFKQSTKYFTSWMPHESPVVLGHNVVGLPIRWDESLTREGIQAITRHVRELQDHKVQARDICILVENQEIRDNVMMELLEGAKMECQTGDDVVAGKDNVIVVESIRRFKGIESKVVTLFDPPFENDVGNKELLYTAVSRCVCYLTVITTQEGCKALQSNQGVKETSPELEKPSDEVIETPGESGPSESLNKRAFKDVDGGKIDAGLPQKVSRKEKPKSTSYNQTRTSHKEVARAHWNSS